jgi:hypothetical protein
MVAVRCANTRTVLDKRYHPACLLCMLSGNRLSQRFRASVAQYWLTSYRYVTVHIECNIRGCPPG